MPKKTHVPTLVDLPVVLVPISEIIPDETFQVRWDRLTKLETDQQMKTIVEVLDRFSKSLEESNVKTFRELVSDWLKIVAIPT